MGWFFLVTMIVLLVGVLIYGRTLHGQARELESFIKGMTLPLTAVALTMIPRRLFRANVGVLIGGAPMLVVLIVIEFSAFHHLGLSGLSIIALLILVGGTLGTAIACTTNIGPSTPELPRVARATRPRMTDYLSPALVVASIAVCATGLVVAILVLPRNTANSAMNSLLVALFAINLLYPGVSDLANLEYVLCFAGLYSWGILTRPGSRFQRRLWPITPQPVVGSYAE